MATLDLRQGTVFAGDYRVLEPLAQGGMGAVYVAEQVSTGRRRALKVMHPILVADDGARGRFVQEAKVGGLVDSDHVVEVIAAGVDDESKMPWLCMELLEGETLHDRISRLGGLPPEELEEVAVQLRHALARAHQKGLVHRDLKPENIFLANPRRTGVVFTVKLLDFGIAKLVQQAKGRKASGTQALGSPLWMAPEQANAQPVSPATDVWAIGLIAFAALTGRVYWRTAATEGDLHLTRLLVEILVDPMSKASERAAELAAAVIPGPGFDRWFARCISREPEGRYREAGACLDALIELLSASDLFTRNDAGTAQLAKGPAIVDSFAKTALSDESFEPIVHGVATEKNEPATAKKKSGMGMGQIAAFLAGSVLVALLLVFGGVASIGLFQTREGDAVPTSVLVQMPTPGTPSPPPPAGGAVSTDLRAADPVPNQDQDPGPPPVPTPPVEAPDDETPGDEPEPGPEVQNPRPPLVAATAAGRVFYSSVVQSCWQDELALHRHGPTRMRLELVLGPDGRSVQNVVVPPAWQRTTFATCIVRETPRARFAEVPDPPWIVLDLPASP